MGPNRKFRLILLKTTAPKRLHDELRADYDAIVMAEDGATARAEDEVERTGVRHQRPTSRGAACTAGSHRSDGDARARGAAEHGYGEALGYDARRLPIAAGAG